MPSPVDGSGRSRSSGAGRHSDQPPLVRNRTRIFGTRTPSRHVKPTIVTSAVSRTGVCQRSVPTLARPRSLQLLLEDPDPGAGVRLEQQPAVAAAVLGVEGAQDPGAGPRDHPGSENGHGGGTQHLSASGTRRARVVVRSHFSLTRHTSDHIGSADHGCTRRARPSAKRSRGVCASPYLFDMAADPQHQEASSNDLFGRWLAHHNEQQSADEGRADGVGRGHLGDSRRLARASRRLPAAAVASSAVERDPLIGIADRTALDLRRPPCRSERAAEAPDHTTWTVSRRRAGSPSSCARFARRRSRRRPSRSPSPSTRAAGCSGSRRDWSTRSSPSPRSRSRLEVPLDPARRPLRPAAGRHPKPGCRPAALRRPRPPHRLRAPSRRRFAPRYRPSSGRSPGTPSRAAEEKPVERTVERPVESHEARHAGRHSPAPRRAARRAGRPGRPGRSSRRTSQRPGRSVPSSTPHRSLTQSSSRWPSPWSRRPSRSPWPSPSRSWPPSSSSSPRAR